MQSQSHYKLKNNHAKAKVHRQYKNKNAKKGHCKYFDYGRTPVQKRRSWFVGKSKNLLFHFTRQAPLHFYIEPEDYGYSTAQGSAKVPALVFRQKPFDRGTRQQNDRQDQDTFLFRV